MCGIAGFWETRPPTFDARALVSAMCGELRHRGPDAQDGVWLPEHGLGLAHTRLAILDLSAAGAQPMRSHDGRLLTVFNGEIYNFHEVRAELERSGHAPAGGWRGGSDTEVLLEACRAWGAQGAVQRFAGMFAFALWDEDARTLTLARDRLGKKPLYYGLTASGLVFGSELKTLTTHPGFDRRLNTGSLALYCRFLYVPDPHCILEGVRKLPPAGLLTLRAADLAARDLPGPERYWRAEDAALAGLRSPLSGPEAEDAVLDALRLAVRQRMIADVPLGAFLSGGIDSSLVVALMQEQSAAPVKTFTIGFREDGHDEAAHARAVATRLGTEHTELYLTAADARAVIPDLPGFYDEPFADSSQLPTHLVSRLARRHVTVALSGDGGDEAFGGYNRYLAAPRLWGMLGRFPAPVRRGLARLLRGPGERLLAGAYGAAVGLLPVAARQLAARDKLQKVVEALDAQSPEAFYGRIVSVWPDVSGLLPAAVPPSCLVDAPPLTAARLPFPAWMMLMDQLTYLPGDILTKVDRASMAVALEARGPLLDHRVVELAWRLPLDEKLGPSGGKLILRRLLARRLPPEIMERPKQGFAVPIAEWLRGPLRAWAEDLLAPQRLRRQGLFAPAAVGQILDEHLRGRRNHQHRLWALLMFQAWQERWLG